jgi:AraC-like DNA-binding protein
MTTCRYRGTLLALTVCRCRLYRPACRRGHDSPAIVCLAVSGALPDGHPLGQTTGRMRRDLKLAGAWTQFVLRGLEGCGLDVRALCQRCGLAYAELNDPDARIPRDASGMIWREAVQMARDPLLGLHAAMRMRLGLNNLLAHLVMVSPTLLDGFQRAARYQRALTHANVLSLARRGEGVAMVLARVDGDLPVTYHEIEFMAGVLARFGTFVLAGTWRLAGVHFQHEAAPGGNDEHVAAFGCPVHFGSDENALLVPLEVITQPSPHRSPAIMRVLEAEATRLVQRLDTPSMGGEVRARLRDGSRFRSSDVNTVARELHLSVRTLQRRLSEEGTRFSDVLDMVRRDVALELLAGGATIERTARSVGLSGSRALIRASTAGMPWSQPNQTQPTRQQRIQSTGSASGTSATASRAYSSRIRIYGLQPIPPRKREASPPTPTRGTSLR